MNLDDIRKLSTEDLIKKSGEVKQEIADMKRRIHMGEATNTRNIRAKRRELARMLTVLGEQLRKERA